MHFPDWQIQEEFTSCYGEVFAGIIDEVLGIVTEVARFSLAESEAKTRVMRRARQLLHQHVPACHEPVAQFSARQAEISAEEGRLRAQNHEEQERRRIAQALRQKNAEELAAQRRRDAAAEEARKLAENRAQFEQEERERQAERDREDQEREVSE